MEKSTDKHRLFSRRAFMISIGQAALLTALGGRLAYLQLFEGDRYKTLAENNRVDMRLLPPSRGIIYDQTGLPLAKNTQNFRLLVTPEQVNDMEVLLKKIEAHLPLTEFEKENFKERVKELPRFVSVELKDGLDWDTVSKIEVNSIDFPGVKIEMGEQRFYPINEATAHVIGYVSSITKEDIQKDRELLRLPNLRIGKTGIERKYEKFLRGKPGTKKMEVNVAGREIRELEKNPPKKGSSIVLSLNRGLQDFVNSQLAKHRSASCVVMNCHTGAIYALCSHPSYDANIYIEGMTPSQWNAYLTNDAYPLNNKAVSGQYPPGSTFKMVTALAAMKEGVAPSNRRIFCPGHYDLGRDRFHCWKRGGHGNVNLVDALAQSCDTYFYQVSKEIGINKIADMAKQLGLAQLYDFDLDEEKKGLMPDEKWKFGHLGSRWQPGETVVASIGQGYIQTTPLQLAVMTSRLVNGGYAVKPWLAHTVGRFKRPPDSWPKIGLNQYDLGLVLKGMDEAVNGPKGTARASRIYNAGYEMGGKTGTAQVRRITLEQRRKGTQQEDIPWRHRHHALFVGYAPLNNPKYVCATVIEHGIGGSATAAPLTKAVLSETQKRDPAKQEIFNPLKVSV